MDIEAEALLQSATREGSVIPNAFGHSHLRFSTGSICRMAQGCLLRAPEHFEVRLNGERKELYRHIFTHEKFGEDVVIIYSQSEMEDRHGGQGGGYERIRLVAKSDIGSLKPIEELGTTRFDALWHDQDSW